MAIAATTAAPVKIGRVRSWIVNSGPVLGIFAVIFVLWELGCWLFNVPDFILPSPSVIIDKIISSWWLLLVNGMVTAQEIVLGFGMSVAIGIPLSVLAVYSRFLVPYFLDLFSPSSLRSSPPRIVCTFDLQLYHEAYTFSANVPS